MTDLPSTPEDFALKDDGDIVFGYPDESMRVHLFSVSHGQITDENSLPTPMLPADAWTGEEPFGVYWTSARHPDINDHGNIVFTVGFVEGPHWGGVYPDGEYWYGEHLGYQVYLATAVVVTIDDILDFFDTHEDVIGVGPGNSAAGRYGAFRNMLVSAKEYIETEQWAMACDQLSVCYEKADGMPYPPDFIVGDEETMVTLLEMITDLMTSIGCFD
jgi:hypothetical protein